MGVRGFRGSHNGEIVFTLPPLRRGGRHGGPALLSGQQFGMTETRCSHQHDEARTFPLSSFPSSSLVEAEPSSLPEKGSSIPDRAQQAPGDPFPKASGAFSEAAAVTQPSRALALVAAPALQTTPSPAAASAADLMLPDLGIVFCTRTHTKIKKKAPKTPEPKLHQRSGCHAHGATARVLSPSPPAQRTLRCLDNQK